MTSSLNPILAFVAILQPSLFVVLYRWNWSKIPTLHEQCESRTLLDGFAREVNVSYNQRRILHGFLDLQDWCSDPGGWDSHFQSAPSWWVWNWVHVSSCWWHSWRSLPLRVLWPPRLVHCPIAVLDALDVMLPVSPIGGGAQNTISGVDTTTVLHRQCQESHCAPKWPILRGYSPIQWLVATSIQLSQSPICIALLLQPRWKSCQDTFHLQPVLLVYQHPKPISTRWTICPKPGAPET